MSIETLHTVMLAIIIILLFILLFFGWRRRP